MESYRTDRGPRQRPILNLGKLDLPQDQWKLLADRIEEKVIGQQSLMEVAEHVVIFIMTLVEFEHYRIERSFRILKSTIQTRPISHTNVFTISRCKSCNSP
jgi:hypothetical protein